MNMRSAKSPKADIVAEASAWFIEFRAGEATASDRARFYEWLHRSPEHIQAYLEIAEGWAELPTGDPEGRIDIRALIERARESRDDNVVSLVSQPAVRMKPHRLSLHAWAASLAAIFVLIGLAVWLLLFEADTYSTGVGEQRMVRLTDGSSIELNALSTIRVRLSEKAREIDLVGGQALFHVAKDRARPFVVRSDGITVRAVGTQFDVYKRRTGTVITVLEGRVAVVEGAAVIREPMLLIAGEQVTIPAKSSAKETPVQPKRTDVAAATAWVQKQLLFDDTPLAEVAEEFNRYSTRQLVIVDPELASLGVSGVYSSTQPEAVLGFLRAQPNIRLSETDEEILVALAHKK